ncbi:MFS transporter [Cystobacter fuscus]|uniref:MFS transporter n=2 Tax=Cystobacter fuscus TaxID=43 RepID=A0A250J6Z3_9BACT|nr:MFS transporter [Cystobacter fuscus]
MGASAPGRGVQGKILAYYIYYLASQAAFPRGIFVLFLMSRQFSGEQIGLLQAVLFWATVASEVPTGMMGDRFGRKQSVSLGLGLFILYCAGVILASGFVPFLLLYCTFGVAKSFISGSDRALLFDYLKAHGREGDFLRIDARSKALGALSLAVAIVVGGYLQRVSWSLVYIAYGLAFVISLAAWSRLQDLRPVADGGEAHEHGIGIVQQLGRFFLRQPGRRLMWIVVGTAFLAGAITPYYIFAQALFQGYGLEPYQIGSIISLAEVLACGAYLLAEYVSRWLSVDRAFYLAAALTAGLLLLNRLSNLWLMMFVFLLVVSIGPLMEVLLGNYFIGKVPGPIRASALSFVSFVQSAVISLGYVCYGYALEAEQLPRLIALSALLPCAAAGCTFVYFKRVKASGATQHPI